MSSIVSASTLLIGATRRSKSHSLRLQMVRVPPATKGTAQRKRMIVAVVDEGNCISPQACPTSTPLSTPRSEISPHCSHPSIGRLRALLTVSADTPFTQSPQPRTPLQPHPSRPPWSHPQSTQQSCRLSAPTRLRSRPMAGAASEGHGRRCGCHCSYGCGSGCGCGSACGYGCGNGCGCRLIGGCGD